MASSLSLHNQCPSCHKQFTNDSNVLRHMNNPRSSCMTWLDFLESVHPPDAQTSPTYQQNHNDETTCDAEATNDSSTDYYEEIHPNEPFIFGSGLGFMDVFNTDQHAEKRKENLYHPFSSKGEWGLASWLLRSGLSMRAIDDFLTLSIVRRFKHNPGYH